MPIEGGDVKIFCSINDGDPNYFGYDVEAHARNVGLKYGVEGVTPEVLRMAMGFAGDTHVGGCELYKDNPFIVRERLQAIVRSQQGPTEMDYIFNALVWVVNKVKGAILSLFGMRPMMNADPASSPVVAPTPEQIVIDAIETQPAASSAAQTPEQVVITAIEASGEVNSRGITPLFATQGAPVSMQTVQPSTIQMLQMQQMQAGAAVMQGAAQMTRPAMTVMPVIPFIDIP
jgi:hypothetical protein